jgi:uncharacterized membrane protein YwaF
MTYVPTPPTPDRSLKNVIMGICTVAAGIWMGASGLESLQTRIPVQMSNATRLEGWIVLPMGAFLVFLGLCIVGVGLGYVKLKRPG